MQQVGLSLQVKQYFIIEDNLEIKCFSFEIFKSDKKQ